MTGQTAGEQTYNLVGYGFRVCWEGEVGKQVVDWLYPAHRAGPPSPSPPVYALTACGADTEVWDEGVLVGTAPEAGRVFGLLEHRVANAALESLRDLGSVHAGAVAQGGSILLLPGDGGSGKTTLTLGLSLAGLQPLGDDVVLIDTDAGLLRAFPRPFMVKGDTARWVSARLPGVGTWPQVGTGAYAVPREHPGPSPVEAGQLKWLVFPRYHPHAQTQLVTLGQAEALRRLVPLTSLAGDAWMPFVRLFRQARLFGLTYSCREQAIELLCEMLAADTAG